MKKYIMLMLVMITFAVCSTATHDTNNTKDNNVTENNTTTIPKKLLVIDLDKKVEDIRGNKGKILDGPIFLSTDNDEVSFRGDILEKNSPVKIKIGDNDEVSFFGREYNIKTLEFKDGDRLIIKDKNGTIFVDKVVREY